MTYGSDHATHLLTSAEQILAGRLSQHVHTLALDIGERHVGRPESLTAAAKYIVTTLQQAGCDFEGHAYEVAGIDAYNIVSEQTGGDRANEIVVIGAHYDTIPNCPGANDNASGIAALLELAAACRRQQFERTLRFVAFVNEEPPFFRTAAMGSLVYARRCRAQGANVVGMCALETIGCYTSVSGSQRYPWSPLAWRYPATGNFVAFISNWKSRQWLKQVSTAFRASTSFPMEDVALPSLVSGVGWSDHWAFWRAGYPAMMVTDTAPFRYLHYHKPSDTPDKLHYDDFARVVTGLMGMLPRLALTVNHDQR